MKIINKIGKNYLLGALVISIFIIFGILIQPLWAGVQALKVSTLEKFGEEYIFESLDWDKDRLEIKVAYEGKRVILPEGKLTFECNLPGRKNRIGRVHFLCLVKVAGETKKRLRLSAEVKISYNIFRPIKSLKMGHVMQAEDVELTRLKSDHVLRNIISDERDIIGHRLIRNLEEGETILAHMVKKIPLVKNGDRILIIAHKGSLRVTAPGIVRQNGFRDDTVRVENIHSKKIILGTVIDSKTVQINF